MSRKSAGWLLFAIICVVSIGPSGRAQSPASNKAFFVAGTTELTLASAANPTPAPIVILDAPEALKTSSVGALQASVSLECALWTYNTVTSTSGGGKNVVTARAAVKVWVEVDGQQATPGQVVFCDRLQAVGLDITTVCTCIVPDLPCSCEVTDTVTLDLFEATKSANAFNYFIGPLSPIVHSVQVKAQGTVECSSNGAAVTCPSQVLNSFANARTAAAIGKRTLVVEEHNNWGVR